MNQESTTVDIPRKSVDRDSSLSERLSDNVKNKIGPARYFQKNAEGETVEDWDDVFDRVASNVAEAERLHHKDPSVRDEWKDKFEMMMRELRFIPNTPTLTSAGTELQMLNACFVRSAEDSMEDIGDAVYDWMMVEKAGGGMGGSFHHLRPKGSPVKSTGGVSSGPMEFIKLFDAVGETIKQGGCISTSERVLTPEGYIPFGEIHDGPPLRESPGNARVFTRDGFDDVRQSSDSGRLPSVEVETAGGYSLTGTGNHPVLTLVEGSFEFTPIENLDEGDTVILDASPSNQLSPHRAELARPEGPSDYHHNTQAIDPDSYPTVLDDDLARLLGVIAGDGFVDLEYNRVIVTLGNDGHADGPASDFFSDYLSEMGFDVNTRNRGEDETDKGDYTRYSVGSKQLVDWLEDNDLIPRDDDPTIPDPVYRTPRAIPSFLGGLTVDACVHTDADTVVYSTAYEDFADKIQDALLLCGIGSTVTHHTYGDGSYSNGDYYKIQVMPGHFSSRYDEYVDHFFTDVDIGSFGGQRQNRVDSPSLVSDILSDNFEKNNQLPDGVDRQSMKELRRYERGERTPSLYRLRNCLLDVGVDPDEYDELDTRYLFETVESVSDVGSRYVCDIENMTGRPEFIASNFIVHNVRSGAQMAIMHSHHPDIGRFCVVKRDEDNLTNFNISVGVTDDFIEAVKNDETYVLENPETGILGEDADPFEVVPESAHFYDPRFEDAWNDEYGKAGVGLDGKVVEENFWRDHYDEMQDPTSFDEFRDRIHLEPGEPMELPARFVWRLMADGAHNNGEPGIFYIDEANHQQAFGFEDNYDHYIHATNPCCAEGTLVNTPSGYSRVETIDEGDKILTVHGSETVDNITSFNDRDVYTVSFSDRTEQVVTQDHRYHIRRDSKSFEEVPLRDVSVGDRVRVHKRRPFDMGGSDDDYLYGLRQGILLGDGCYTENQLNQHNRVKISTSVEDESFNTAVKDLFSDYRIGSDDVSNNAKSMSIIILDGSDVVEDHNLDPAKSPSKTFDDTTIRNEHHALGIIDGLVASDGNVSLSGNHPQVRYDTRSKDLAETFRRACLYLGYHGRLTIDENPSEGVIDGREISFGGSMYTGHISGESLRSYTEDTRLHKYHPRKSDRLREIYESYQVTGNTWLARIESVDYAGTETVYDLYCAGSDTWVTDGYVQQGCAEEPLSEYNACTLGHVNLSLMVDDHGITWDEFNDDWFDDPNVAARYFLAYSLDDELLEETIQHGVRFLDNVITQSEFPVDEISEVVESKRKIGLGIMGFAQMLVQLGVEYGSDISYDIAEEIMRIVDGLGTKYSHELAKERGAFDCWSESKWSNPTDHPDWFRQHAHMDPENAPSGYPMRNHAVTTVAPTGCVKKGTIVSTTDGLQRIENTGSTEDGSKWGQTTTDVVTDEGVRESTSYFDNGFVPTKTITTSNGFTVTATPDHRFRVIDDTGDYVWRESQNIREGDNIVLHRNTFVGGGPSQLDTQEKISFIHNTDDDLSLPSTMSEDLAEFLGYYMGDGYVHDRVGVKMIVDSREDELIEYLEDLSESVFGVTPTRDNHRDSTTCLVVGGRHLPRYFEDNGWVKDKGNTGEGSASAFIPDNVLSSDRAHVEAFIRGLFEADGCASRKVELSTVSETLASQVQTALLSLGHVFAVDSLPANEIKGHYGDRTRYRLRGANKFEDKKFIDSIGFITKGTDISLTNRSFKNDTYPSSLADDIRNTDGYYGSCSSYLKKRVNRKNISARTLRLIESETGEDVTLSGGQRLLDLYIDTVESVEDTESQTFDIEVPDNRTYVSDGFVSHNTTSRVADTTGGCEPYYNTVFFKNVSEEIQGDEMLVVFDSYLREVLEANDIDPGEVEREAVELMKENKFESIGDVSLVPDEIDNLFVTSEDLSIEQHLKMQGAFQSFCDSGISKTANCPVETEIDEIEDAMLLATDLGIKGTTIYRQGSRQEQVNTTKLDNKQFSQEEKESIMSDFEALIRSDEEAAEQAHTLLTGGDE